MGELIRSMFASLNKPVRILNTYLYGIIDSRGMDGSIEVRIFGIPERRSVHLSDVEFITEDEFEIVKIMLG